MTHNDPEPIATSLGKLSDHDWQVLRHTWSRGQDWFVFKVGKRHWRLAPAYGNFPLFKTKTEAERVGSNLILAESRHRAWIARQQDLAA